MNNHWLCVLCGEGGGFKSSRDLIFTPAHAFIFTSSASHIFNLATHKQLLLCFFNINYMQSCNNIVALPLLISVSQRPEFPFVCCGFVFFFSGHKTLAFFSCSSFFRVFPSSTAFCTLQLFSHAPLSLSGSSLRTLLSSRHFLLPHSLLSPAALTLLGSAKKMAQYWLKMN